jgi:hypothetical protein
MSSKGSPLDDRIPAHMFGFLSVLVDWFAPILLVQPCLVCDMSADPTRAVSSYHP